MVLLLREVLLRRVDLNYVGAFVFGVVQVAVQTVKMTFVNDAGLEWVDLEVGKNFCN